MPQNHKAKCGGCRQNTVFSTITSTEYGRIIRRQRTLINELKENKELLEDKLRLAEGKERSLNSALEKSRNRVEKIMTTYDEIILDKMSEQNMLIEKNAKCGDELYQKNILIADLNKEIVKNHELYKFNTIMSYLAIVVAILQYFL
jgi:transposase